MLCALPQLRGGSSPASRNSSPRRRSRCSSSSRSRAIPTSPRYPTVLELAPDESDRALMDPVFAQQQRGRPFFPPPALPPEGLAALRQAFDAMMHAGKVLADAESHHIEINQPLPGSAIERLVGRLHGFPPALIARAVQVV